MMASVLVAFGALPAQAQNTVYNFTNLDANGSYNDANNWDMFAVPDLTTTNTADIGGSNGTPGVAVTYTPGGDLVIKNGGVLEVTSGSFTQAAGSNNYLQLNGGGTVLVDGGTFNQGPISSNPFNVTGTGNAFTISSGAVNLDTSFSLAVGLNFSMTGGTLTVPNQNAGGGNLETDFNSTTATMSGGVFTTRLITGVNGGAQSTFNIAGGMLTLTDVNTPIYGGGTTHYINFTLNSTGVIDFTGTGVTTAQVQNYIAASVIEVNNATATAAAFNIQGTSGNITLSLAGAAVPEPSTVALTVLGVLGLAYWTVRRGRNQLTA